MDDRDNLEIETARYQTETDAVDRELPDRGEARERRCDRVERRSPASRPRDADGDVPDL